MEGDADRRLPLVDSYSREFYENPNAKLAEMCPHSRVARGQHGVEFLAYDMVESLLADRRFRPIGSDYFAGLGATPIVTEFVDDGLLLMMETGRHDRIRRILYKAFTPRRIEAWHPVMRDFANALVDGVAASGRMDLVADFSHRFSIGIISRFIGAPPEDVPTFEHATVELRLLGERPLEPFLPRLGAALAAVRDYAAGLVARRQAAPGEDFISDVIEAQKAEGKLSEAELVWAVANLLLAGHDTTRYQLAACVRAILEGAAWERLAHEPALVERAVEEGMRLYPVTVRNTRIARSGADFAGESFAAGEVAVLNMMAAGRDASRFADPDRFDLDRGGPGWDIGFGLGPHLCLGHALARAELIEAVKVLTARLTAVELDGAVELSPMTAFLAGPESMPLRFRVR